MINCKDYKLVDISQGVKRFYRIGKYNKGIKWGWIARNTEVDPELRMTTCLKVNGS
jgi:hypothetical protein